MSAPTGIPTYTSAPLNPDQKEEGTSGSTSQTEPATSIEASATDTPQPPNTSATATAPPYAPIYATAQGDNPLPAQPGAAPSLPAPTAATVSQTGTLVPTPTSALPTATTYTPPAPQPGATPVAPVSGVPAASTSPVPPPPKAGEPVSASTIPSAPTQSSFTQSYAYQRTPQTHAPAPNSTTTPYSSVYPPAVGSSRPQGLPLYGGNESGGGANNIFGDDEEPGLFNAAKGWMQTAGTKLAEVEAEMWKRINDVHK